MITDHVFRLCNAGGTYRAITPGRCWYLGRCNRPQGEHITHLDFRATRDRTAGTR